MSYRTCMSFRGARVSQWGEQRRQPVRLAYLTYFYCTNRESVVTPLYQPPWFKSDRQRREDLAVCNTRERMVKPEWRVRVFEVPAMDYELRGTFHTYTCSCDPQEPAPKPGVPIPTTPTLSAHITPKNCKRESKETNRTQHKRGSVR